jgi:hypothetical protein
MDQRNCGKPDGMPKLDGPLTPEPGSRLAARFQAVGGQRAYRAELVHCLGELSGPEGFDQVCRGSGGHAGHFIVGLGPGRNEQHRRFGPCPDIPGDVQAVHVRQVQIHRDQDRVVFPGRSHPVSAIGHSMNIEAHSCQDQREQIPDVLVILDDQAKPS